MGADSIEKADWLRHTAPQLHAVHRRFGARTQLLPEAGQVASIDADSTHRR
ncbi:hypothetical protein ACFZCY_43465 [Streptomyces sp. NPDC007983]|uniref:hypothetical protein n=1 Tax=Streptomyces sp. NPDC007983 TaxID=3364800 RepID=UPI0036DFD457